MSSSTRPKAMLLYGKDFVADTQHLSTEEVGAYVLLLIAAWNGVAGCPPCHLPADPRQLARIARVTPRRWSAIKPRLLLLFGESGEPAGYLFQRRQLAEYREQLARSASATASAHARHGRGGADGLLPFRRRGA